ncbi:MAG: hypothetical protein MI866_15260 [Bacteroidales bacterium]|nr:hypothetical protein [Bacteroidales bacterium]
MLGCNSRVCLEIESAQDLIHGIEKGVNVFIPVDSDLPGIFNTLSESFEKKPNSSFILINLHYNDSVWNKAIEISELDKLLINTKQQINNQLFTYTAEPNTLISFSQQATRYSFALHDFIINRTDSTSRLNKTNDFLLTRLNYSSANLMTDEDLNNHIRDLIVKHGAPAVNLLNQWLTTGKRPHFIICCADNLERCCFITQDINKTDFHSVKFILNNEKFAPVKIPEAENLISGGRVSFPILQTKSEITPKSRGYRFSPDIFRFTHEHQMVEIPITAIPLPLNHKQITHFHFDKSEAPGSNFIENIYASSNTMLQKDKQRGKVFYFDGKGEYIDCGSHLNIDFTKPITISVWVKPEKMDQDHSLVGLGNTFSMKIRNSRLTFTQTDVSDINFKDYTIEPDTWHHLAIVNEPNNQLSFYQDGNKIGTSKIGEIANADHALLIGTNIWGEYYQGFMDDLIIWNRALSDQELIQLNQLESDNKDFGLILGLITLVIASLAITIWWLKWRSARSVSESILINSAKDSKTLITEQTRQVNSCLLTFGEFRIINSEGHNLATELSPKEKQLLIYLLWHTYRNNKEGVSSRQLSEDLWPGISNDRAKNNRSTYMQRLRKLLTDSTGIQITYSSSKKWILVLPPSYTCDLETYEKVKLQLNKERNRHNLQVFLNTLLDGKFLSQTRNELIDTFKSEIENEIILLLTEPDIIEIAKNNNRITPTITATIRKYDPLSETALSLEISWLYSIGHHGRALEVYQRFCNDYEALYGEHFNRKMDKLLT